MMADIAAETCR